MCSLHAAGKAPNLELITNRTLDRAHPLLGHVDGRSDLLTPYAGQAGLETAAGKALQAWADHIPAGRDDLLDMLSHLIFRTGLTITTERDHVQTLMLAAALEGTEDSLQGGLDCVAGWITAGKRIATAAEIRETADELGLRRSDPAAILVVQAIDTDPHAAEATIALDWVALYDGDRPSLRFQPRDPSGWARMEHDLTSAAAALENAGWRSTLVRGALRQATFFRVGTVLPAVRHHTLYYIQGSQPWSTDTPKAPIHSLQTSATPIPAGNDIAVAIGVAVNPTPAVLTYIRDARLAIHHLLTILPGGGADDQAVASPGQAVAYAQTIRDLVREDLENHPDTPRLHLFLAGPGGLAYCSVIAGTAHGPQSPTSTSAPAVATREHSPSGPDLGIETTQLVPRGEGEDPSDTGYGYLP